MTHRDLLFSLVIPTYNRAHLVGDTLQSVLAQRYSNFELIIVDDGSTDNTVDVVRGFGDKVRVFETQHAGCAAARNIGVRHATGDYIVFLDSDDLWFPWSLETYARAIQQCDQAPAVVAGQLFRFVDPRELDDVVEREMITRWYKDYFTGAAETSFFAGTMVCAIRRDGIERVGGCTEQNTTATDSDLLFRMGLDLGFVKIEQPVVLGYRWHDANILKDPKKVEGGAYLLLESEQQGKYPGGSEYRGLRELQIGARVRKFSLVLLKQNCVRGAVSIFWKSIRLNIRNRKWAYLTAFPLMVLLPPLRRG